MNIKDARELLRSHVSAFSCLSEFQEVEPLFYTKATNGVSRTIGFGCSEIRGAKFQYGYTVGIRFEALQQILDPESVSANAPTVLIPHHFFETGHKYFQWQFATADELRENWERTCLHINQNASRFWSEIPSVQALHSKLHDSSFRKNIILDNTRMVRLEAAVLYAEGFIDDARTMLINAISNSDLPKKRRPIEDLLKYFDRAV